MNQSAGARKKYHIPRPDVVHQTDQAILDAATTEALNTCIANAEETQELFSSAMGVDVLQHLPRELCSGQRVIHRPPAVESEELDDCEEEEGCWEDLASANTTHDAADEDTVSLCNPTRTGGFGLDAPYPVKLGNLVGDATDDCDTDEEESSYIPSCSTMPPDRTSATWQLVRDPLAKDEGISSLPDDETQAQPDVPSCPAKSCDAAPPTSSDGLSSTMLHDAARCAEALQRFEIGDTEAETESHPLLLQPPLQDASEEPAILSDADVRYASLPGLADAVEQGGPVQEAPVSADTDEEPELMYCEPAEADQDAVLKFQLDEDFDYDNVELTPKYPPGEPRPSWMPADMRT
jgi:hypothetical protein